jgi:adenylate kinase family enzyme
VRRVLVVGGPGSGKTTFARVLSAQLGVPHVELDRLAYDHPEGRRAAAFHEWTRVADVDRRERAAVLAASEGWVAEGLYAGWTAALRDAADVVVWIDLPARVTTWRVLRQAVEHRRGGGRDWDVRSIVRVVGGARSYRSRPLATAEQLRERDGANGTRMLEAFLRDRTDRVIRCRTAAQVRHAARRLVAAAK